MTNHTPEPWKDVGFIGAPASSASSGYLLIGNTRDRGDHGDGTGCDRQTADANRARIVACVNACAGINPAAVPDLMAVAKSTVLVLDSVQGDLVAFEDSEDLQRPLLAALDALQAILTKVEESPTG